MKEIKAWQTTDGNVFTEKLEAAKHEEKISAYNRLKQWLLNAGVYSKLDCVEDRKNRESLAKKMLGDRENLIQILSDYKRE